MRNLLFTTTRKLEFNFVRGIISFIAIILLATFPNSNFYGQCTAVSGEISGKVLLDNNFNDLKDASDFGVSNVRVLGYDEHQTLKAEAPWLMLAM